MRNKLIKVLVLVFMCLVAVGCGSVQYTSKVDVPTRKIEIIEDSLTQIAYLETFEDASIETVGTVTNFVGYKTLDKSLFEELDNVSLSNIPDEGIKVRYEYYFDYVTDACSMSAITELNGEIIEIETIHGTACINAKGEIDALMEIDGEFFMLSDIKENVCIENCGWFKKALKTVAIASAVVAVAAAVAVASVFSCGMVGCIVAGAVAGAVAGGVVGGVIEKQETGKVTVGGVAACAGVGAVVGAVAGATVGGVKEVVTAAKGLKLAKAGKVGTDIIDIGGTAEEVITNTADDIDSLLIQSQEMSVNVLNNLVNQATKPGNVKTICLGNYNIDYPNLSYNSIAEAKHYYYFSLDNYNELAKTYGKEQMREVNRKWLEKMIKEGYNIVITTDPGDPDNWGNGFRMEMEIIQKLFANYDYIWESFGDLWKLVIK